MCCKREVSLFYWQPLGWGSAVEMGIHQLPQELPTSPELTVLRGLLQRTSRETTFQSASLLLRLLLSLHKDLD